jgi:phage protein D
LPWSAHPCRFCLPSSSSTWNGPPPPPERIESGESDASFLTRLSGVPLEAARITRRDGDQHRFSFADRETAGAVRACRYDTDKSQKMEIIVTDPNAKEKRKAKKTTDRIKTLRHTYANREDAERAAKAALDKIQRGVATFSLTLAYRRPDLIPDLPAFVYGWKKDIDEVDWLITKVTHRLSNSGYVTELEMETRGRRGGRGGHRGRVIRLDQARNSSRMVLRTTSESVSPSRKAFNARFIRVW